MTAEKGVLRSPEALASLVAVNVTPLAGILLLGWQPVGVLISYFVDTFVGFCSVMMLTMIHVTGDEEDTPIEGWRRWSKLVGALVFLAALILLPLALPLVFVFGIDRVVDVILEDSGLRLGLAVQVAMSVFASMRVHRQLVATHDDDRILAGRALFLAARWIVVFAAVATGLVPALGPRVGSLVLIAFYAAASIWFELHPEQAIRFVRGLKSGPIAYQKDLDSRAAGDRGDTTRR